MVRFWELIEQQYDQMVKYATALRLGTAEAEQVLRRFTRGGPKHPTYQALEEHGDTMKDFRASITSLSLACICVASASRASLGGTPAAL